MNKLHTYFRLRIHLWLLVALILVASTPIHVTLATPPICLTGISPDYTRYTINPQSGALSTTTLIGTQITKNIYNHLLWNNGDKMVSLWQDQFSASVAIVDTKLNQRSMVYLSSWSSSSMGVSSDGRYLAIFDATTNRKHSVLIVSTADGKPTTSEPWTIASREDKASYANHGWSPQGHQFAYLAAAAPESPKTSPVTLRLITPEGNPQSISVPVKNWTTELSYIGRFDWSPDGQYLLLSDKFQLGIYSVNTGQFEALSVLDLGLSTGQADRAMWSPTGHMLVYMTGQHGLTEQSLMAFDVETNTRKVLAKNTDIDPGLTAYHFSYQLSPGFHYALVAHPLTIGGDSYQYTVVNLSTGDETPITPKAEAILILGNTPLGYTSRLTSFSGDMAWDARSRTPSFWLDDETFVLVFKNSLIWAKADGSKRYEYPLPDYPVMISRQADWTLYEAYYPDGYYVLALDNNQGKIIRLKMENMSRAIGAVSPDGKMIGVAGMSGNNSSITTLQIIPFDLSPSHTVKLHSPNPSGLFWAPDSQSLTYFSRAYLDQDEFNDTLYVLRPNGSITREIDGGHLTFYPLSDPYVAFRWQSCES